MVQENGKHTVVWALNNINTNMARDGKKWHR